MEVYVSGGVDVVEDGEVIAGMVAGVEGAGPRLRVMSGLGGDGVGVIWWKDLLVEVIFDKVKEKVKFW